MTPDSRARVGIFCKSDWNCTGLAPVLFYLLTYDDDRPVDPNTVLCQSNSGGDQPKPCFRRLNYSEQVRAARQVQHDYTFTNPAYRQEHRAAVPFLEHQSKEYERFDYPGRYKRDAVGKPFTENRITALRHDVRIAEVEGDDVRLQPGLSFTLTGHPRDDLNAHWRVNMVTHKDCRNIRFRWRFIHAWRGSTDRGA
ncbi:contractile injection system protein, VgrG/Pvc8 family [Stenotrophomonas lactitubi]|uniref:contractile injection system protein, VgrG/Pvc8 family n=1 Tax=Stenotrophomonas lactitubi TaxID=2045214 RepID=UPI001E3D9871|nr:contractile injection system protein, VgrG/Pvc8 family [Stenotrophomonas lactitubi]